MYKLRTLRNIYSLDLKVCTLDKNHGRFGSSKVASSSAVFRLRLRRPADCCICLVEDKDVAREEWIANKSTGSRVLLDKPGAAITIRGLALQELRARNDTNRTAGEMELQVGHLRIAWHGPARPVSVEILSS